MKKMYFIFMLITACFIFAACSDENINKNDLPQNVQKFIEENFPGSEITSAVIDKSAKGKTYDVLLDNGKIDLEFDKNGEWTEIDYGTDEVPNKFIPDEIEIYVEAKYPNQFIVEISKYKNKIEIELNDNTKLIFDTNGNIKKQKAVYRAKPVDPSETPVNEEEFVSQYFPNEEIATIEENTNEEDADDVYYEITLKSETEIELDKNGNWIEIDCEEGFVPDELVPEGILNNVNNNYEGKLIISIEKDEEGFEIELNDGTELNFDAEGNVIPEETDTYINPEELPEGAKIMISENFPNNEIEAAKIDEDEDGNTYEVDLNNSVELKFDELGVLIEIDCEDSAVPSQFIPTAITEYVTTNFEGKIIVKLNIEDDSIEIKLNSGEEIVFDKDYNFIEMEK